MDTNRQETADAVLAFFQGKEIQRSIDRKNWEDVTIAGVFDVWRYYFRQKPEPKTLPWSKPEHVPLNCWMRPPSQDNQRMVTAIKDDGMFIDSVCNGGGSVFFKWSELREFTYSTDRITWQPCVVTEP